MTQETSGKTAGKPDDVDDQTKPFVATVKADRSKFVEVRALNCAHALYLAQTQLDGIPVEEIEVRVKA